MSAYRSPSPSPYYYGPDAQQFPRSHSPAPPPRSHSPQPPIQRAYSPAPPPVQRAYSPQPPAQQSPGAIQPGSITYTSATGPDGRQVYQQFKAVPASYQTPQGIISGIQWVPVEATSVLPAGAMPAGPDFQASWDRGQVGNQDNRNFAEWEAEKRRKEEEQAARAARESRLGHGGYDADLAAARERDAALVRERRKSISQGSQPYPGSGHTPGGYPSSNYSAGGYPERAPSAASGYTGYPTSGGGHNRDPSYDLENRMNNMDLRDRDRGYEGPGTRERKVSLGRPRQYSTSENAGGNRSRAVSGNLGARPEPYGAPPAGPYGSAAGPYNASTRSTAGSIPHASPNMRAASPNMRPGELPYNPGGAVSGLSYPGANYSSSPNRPPENLPRSTTPFGSPTAVYPRGHVMEGKPIPPHSRAASPNPGGIPSAPSVGGPHGGGPAYPNPVSFPSAEVPQYGRPTSPNPMGELPVAGQQLQAPNCFSRPVNAGKSYAPFKVFKIQDMEKFWTAHPHIPRIMEEHDMYPEDWERLMKDVSLAWAGRLPVPDFARAGKSRPSALTADLIDLWNSSFFAVRGVELVLYKGRERRSGNRVGQVDRDLPYLDEPDDYPSSEEEEEEDDDSDPDVDAHRSNYLYSPTQNQHNTIDDVFETGRRRREAKIREREERRARRHEKNKRRREKYRQSKYSLYVYYNPSQMAAGMGSPHMGNMPVPASGGYPGSAYSSSGRGGYPDRY